MDEKNYMSYLSSCGCIIIIYSVKQFSIFGGFKNGSRKKSF